MIHELYITMSQGREQQKKDGEILSVFGSFLKNFFRLFSAFQDWFDQLEVNIIVTKKRRKKLLYASENKIEKERFPHLAKRLRLITRSLSVLQNSKENRLSN